MNQNQLRRFQEMFENQGHRPGKGKLSVSL